MLVDKQLMVTTFERIESAMALTIEGASDPDIREVAELYWIAARELEAQLKSVAGSVVAIAAISDMPSHWSVSDAAWLVESQIAKGDWVGGLNSSFAIMTAAALPGNPSYKVRNLPPPPSRSTIFPPLPPTDPAPPSSRPRTTPPSSDGGRPPVLRK